MSITITTEKDYPLTNRLLTRIGFGVNLFDRWLRDSIQKAKTDCMRQLNPEVLLAKEWEEATNCS